MVKKSEIISLIKDRLIPIQNSISMIDIGHAEDDFSQNMLTLEDVITQESNMLENNLVLEQLLTSDKAVKDGVSMTLEQGKSSCLMTSLAYQMIIMDLEKQRKFMESDEYKQMNGNEQNVSALMHQQREIGMLMVLQNELNTLSLSFLADSIRLGELNDDEIDDVFSKFEKLKQPVMGYVKMMKMKIKEGHKDEKRNQDTTK